LINYAIITPLKNEAEHLAQTILSVCNQSDLPILWVIVDDGSSDNSREILNQHTAALPWVKIVDAPIIKKTDYSSRVIDLFNYGLSNLSIKPQFICKMDADVSFGKDFFKHILAHFEKNPKLAIASGHLHNNGVPESIDLDNVVCTRGATKVYRTSFLDEIGGLISYQGWDTLDNVAARAKGWQVLIVDEPFEHLKEEGVRVGKTIFRHIRNGYYNGSLPFYFPYFLIKIIVKSLDRPIFFSSVFMLWGYIKARMNRVKSPYPDYVIRHLRKEQKSYLMKKLNLV
jgi:cellulose synthase/poly-beta-1,6-N-acetylglucosamine synthase-like glycosyltransferase